MSIILESEENSFLQLIKRELSFKSTDEVLPRIAAVLQAYRQTLTTEQANLIVNELPDYFKIAFITNWHYADETIKMDHLDEFVELLLSRDKDLLFKSEVEALSVSILVFKKIVSLCKKNQLSAFSPSLLQQIEAIPSEAVAA